MQEPFIKFTVLPENEYKVLSKEEVAAIEARKEASIQAAQLTPGTATKHMRLSIDFHIMIAGTPPEDDGRNDPDPVYHARQARLLEAVKNNPQVLKKYMCYLIGLQMDWADWDAVTGGDIAYEKMLAPAFAALPEEDQAFFAKWQKTLYFEDMMDLFIGSFVVQEDLPVINEIEAE